MAKATNQTGMGRKLTAPLTLGTITALSLATSAGVKYWDNQDFKPYDVGDYVPGAVWNYDGIRNQGADQPHSTTATTWKNLGTSGSGNDMFIRIQNQSGNGWGNTSALYSLGTVNGRNTGSWTDNGFAFAGDSELRYNSPGRIDTGNSYTIQMLVDGTIAGQAYPYTYLMSIQKDHFAFMVDKSAGKLYWKTQNGTTSNHPFMTDGSFGYMTAILDGSANTAAFFSGTVPPTSGDGFRQFSSVSGKSDTGGCICGYTAYDGFFTGTMHSYRYYTKVLSEEELAWNRVVDEARFFGRKAPIPVTNIIVTANYPRVNADQPNGNYYIDDGGFTFTASASTNVYGRAYACTGYTLETWDEAEGVWSAPISYESRSCTVADTSAKIRLTWQWTAGDGLVTYDIDDYVWDGLALFYDGIRNQGVDKPHSTTATTWKNLGSWGVGNDLFVQRLSANGSTWEVAANLDPVGEMDPGEWTENGFKIDGEGRFRCDGQISAGTSYTVQQLFDAKSAEQPTADAFTMALNSTEFGFQINKADGRLYWRTQGTELSKLPPYMSAASYGYFTAILNGTENSAVLFSGTTAPTSGMGFKQYESVHGWDESGYCLGGFTRATTSQRFVGTFKSFRYYDRILTHEELETNRKVDNWRFFHAPEATNIIVATTNPNLQGSESEGAYEVSGAYTFTAPATVTAKGVTYTNDGYTVETWTALADKGNGWSAATHYAGNSYNYSTTAGKVRLTWKWKATRGLRSAADYGFDDYSQAGIVWNFDGIYNQGVGLDRSTTATTWKNLAPNPVTERLFVQRVNGKKDGYVNDDSTILGSLNETDGNWTNDVKGFTMYGLSRWRGLGQVGPVANWTLQTLIYANITNIVAKDIAYVLSVSWPSFALALRRSGNGPVPNCFYFNTQEAHDVTRRPYFQNESGEYDYATAILDSSDCTAKMFQGVTPPTGGGVADGYYKFSSITPFKDTNFGIAAPAGSYDQCFVGTLKSIRYYDRVLTEEEIVRNRNVDAVRYFGALGVTNVFVVAGGEGAVQPESGAYKVEGEWTFTAPLTTIDKRGDTVIVKRYSIEELVNGAWTNKTTHDGTSYTYVEGVSPATVRLTWLGSQIGTTMLFR